MREIFGVDLALRSTGIAHIIGDSYRLFTVKTPNMPWYDVIPFIIDEINPIPGNDFYIGFEDFSSVHIRQRGLRDRVFLLGALVNEYKKYTGVIPFLASPKLIRKLVIGNGNADKEQVYNYVKDNYIKSVQNYDEADAFCTAKAMEIFLDFVENGNNLLEEKFDKSMVMAYKFYMDQVKNKENNCE